MSGGVVIAATRRKERELRDEFFRASATQPIGARSLAELGVEENMTWRRLCRRSIVREAAPGLFYWDDDVWQAFRSQRRRMALMMVAAVILVLLIIGYGSTKLK